MASTTCCFLRRVLRSVRLFRRSKGLEEAGLTEEDAVRAGGGASQCETIQLIHLGSFIFHSF